ncbi:hypothetical protein A9Q84_18790 [Halobacteriovorax marinus]|uniref:DUF2288 domain-containing protein n=1 Tax=Halobacteriovorax marinus TaxID=97084 RepID=A0A1Y5F266_9BACT|nr:hypothetical protein A9Q84_18790 [Halobacteriovorax marinus]
MENLKEKLTGEREKARWLMLEEHNKREALLIVATDLDLIDVAVAVASDDVKLIKTLLDSEQLKRPDETMVKLFEEETDFNFNFVIIQPYVLAQKIEE